MPGAKQFPTLPFASARKWEGWLSKHHAAEDGVWIKMARRSSGIASVTHDEALDVALCYGWIDGQRNGLDSTHFLQKFTPRRPKSTWSKRNVAKVEMLSAAGRMRPTGMAEVEAAKKDGRWAAAYNAQKDTQLPHDFMEALAKSKRAKATFNTLNRQNVFAIAFRLQSAKRPVTRQRRFDDFLAMLERGEKLYP